MFWNNIEKHKFFLCIILSKFAILFDYFLKNEPTILKGVMAYWTQIQGLLCPVILSVHILPCQFGNIVLH